MKRLAFCMFLVMFAALPAEAQEQEKQAELPVTRVVLFSSGVGYFEHAGSVTGDATAELMFKTDQINDVLKSMVVMDLDGGTVTAVNYASRDPLVRALKSFAVDISGDPKFSALLKQLRGAQIVIQAPEKITGRILGIETKTRKVTAGGTTTILTEAVLNIVTDEGIKSIPMETVQNVTFTDAKLSAELNKALTLLIESHDTQRKPVQIRFSGEGKRRVSVGYVAETPVWKTSYRLDLTGEKPFLKGWAIVENTSDADWSQVGLALVSGRPISFVQDLYTPLYLPRPVVKPELYASLRPRRYEEGIEEAEAEPKDKDESVLKTLESNRRMRRGLAAGARAPAPSPAPSAELARGRPGGEMDLGKSVRSIASAGKVGELFHFQIKTPVALPRRRSSMLPIVNSPVKAEKVSIYNASVQAKHPLSGAYLINDTGLKLPAGPVTVFDGNMYAGDAQVGNLTPGDKRLLSYAIDLEVTVDPSVRSSSSIIGARIVRGTLYVQRKHKFDQTYAIRNKSEAGKQVIVEHSFNAQRKLIEPEKYEEKTPALYRFRVPVEKGATKEFVVREEQVHSETVAILGRSADSLLWYSKNAEISEKVRDALATAIRLKQELTALQKRLAELVKQKQAIESGQERLRRNISTAGRTSTLGKRYLTKLSEEEDDIERLEADISEQRVQIERKQKELADYLNKLNVD